MLFRFLLIASLICIAAATTTNNQKSSRCAQEFRKCVEAKTAVADCETNLVDCAESTCNCFDIVKHGHYVCRHENQTSASLKACFSRIQSEYKTCAQACNHSTVSDIHKSAQLTSTDLFGLSLCTLCTDVVGFLESNTVCQAATWATKFCGSFAFICKPLVTEACNMLQSYLSSNPKATPQAACTFVHACSASSVSTSASSKFQANAPSSSGSVVDQQHLITIPNLSPSGVSDFFGSVDDSTDTTCTQTSALPQLFTCTGVTSLSAALPASSSTDDSSSSSSSSSSLDGGAIAAVVMGVALAVVLAAFFIYVRRNGRKAVGVDGGYTNMTENRL
jgi:hypothetical protein